MSLLLPAPHLAGYRARSVSNIVDELSALCERFDRPYVIFRDPLFTVDRDRALALADGIRTRGLDLRFECETRVDRLDPGLLDALHAAGLRAMSFGVESVSDHVLKKVGRRPTPEAQQRLIIRHCRAKGIATAAFYVLGFPHDTWASTAATIDYSIDLGSTAAQFKLLTPYPGTPLWKHLAPRVYERDWEKFDGFTPTFEHPSLSAEELRFLLGAAYAGSCGHRGSSTGRARRLRRYAQRRAMDRRGWRGATRARALNDGGQSHADRRLPLTVRGHP
jgi:radical SAM superfamily enzyme YgiQ (UPF0313 family)